MNGEEAWDSPTVKKVWNNLKYNNCSYVSTMKLPRFVASIHWKIIHWESSKHVWTFYITLSNLSHVLSLSLFLSKEFAGFDWSIRWLMEVTPLTCNPGLAHWSSGYGRRLTFERSWVWIPAPYTGWTWQFSHWFVVKIVLFVWKIQK